VVTFELYDLRADPGEKDDLLAGDGGDQSPAEQVKTELLDKLLGTVGATSFKDLELQDSSDIIDPETEAQLRALGYIY